MWGAEHAKLKNAELKMSDKSAGLENAITKSSLRTFLHMF